MKLHQNIALEKGVRQRTFALISDIYKTFQKPALFNGQKRSYTPLTEDGEGLPSENVKVQQTVPALLAKISDSMAEHFDVACQRDLANCGARADVVVDGQVILSQVPATFLLFLEKQLGDVKSELAKLPELDSAKSWRRDDATGLFETDPTTTVRTKKVQKALVLYPATDKHPAQTQLITEDVNAGNWSTTFTSGAIPPVEKERLQKRLQALLDAVKMARATANEADAPKSDAGRKIFAYLALA